MPKMMTEERVVMISGIKDSKEIKNMEAGNIMIIMRHCLRMIFFWATEWRHDTSNVRVHSLHHTAFLFLSHPLNPVSKQVYDNNNTKGRFISIITYA